MDSPRQSTSPDLDTTFAALANPTRRAILQRLATGEATVLELAQPFAMSQPAITKHLDVLERAGLIARTREAQRRPCRLRAEPLANATEWLEGYRGFWEGSFARLDAVLEQMKSAAAPPAAPAPGEPDKHTKKKKKKKKKNHK